MELYVVRHGIAEDIGEGQGRSDFERGLTQKGRERTRQVAEALAGFRCRPDCIATSPLRRTRQTAEILARILTDGLEPEECAFLAPGGRVAELLDWLSAGESGSVMIVGHMPDLALMASVAIAGDERASIGLKKGGSCRIDFDDGPGRAAGRLVWLIQPRQILDLLAAGSGDVV